MSSRPEIVITALGVVSPLGIGCQALADALWQPRSGVGPITLCDPGGLRVHLAGEVRDFDAKQFIPKQHRKSLKIMSRSMQMGIAAAQQAWQAAGMGPTAADTPGLDPDRVGVVFGADNMCTSPVDASFSYVGCVKDGHTDMAAWQARTQATSFPLGMLWTLPNLAASHVSIVLDARGPNNTHHHNEVSSLMAIAEAMRVIERGAADVMIAGGVSSLTDPFDWARQQVLDELSGARNVGAAPRPFDLNRDGQVRGEGAGALVLEGRRHAEARGAKILARLPGYGAAAQCHYPLGGVEERDRPSGRGDRGATLASPHATAVALRRSIEAALRDARLAPSDIGFVSAQGLGTRCGDAEEAAAIAQAMPDVPVTAPKSFFGNLGAAAGAVEAVAAVLALERRAAPVTLNYTHPDPACPVPVIHGEPRPLANSAAMLLSYTPIGQAATLIVAGE
jgi:3-oxoacyl-[acyl-carrier-protein] synthase II